MKLFKVLYVVGDWGVSVFPRSDEELPPIPDIAGEPMSDIIKQLVFKGYTSSEAYWAVQAWAYHASVQLHQSARGVRIYCEMCAKEIPMQQIPGPPLGWGVILTVAIAAAVVLGLYLWATLDGEKNVRLGTHKWAYLMSYEERLWQAEILNVGVKQAAYYEKQFYFGEVIGDVTRNIMEVKREDRIYVEDKSIVLEGRRILFYHYYNITAFKVMYCGLTNNVGNDLYKLREGGFDNEKPRGPWSRPGGRWGQPDYEGCWGTWWWF